MIKAALQSFAADSRRSWSHDRSQTVGASEIGQCARKVWFLKNEDDPTVSRARDADYSDRWGATVRGSTYEAAWWEPALRARYGDALLYAGADQRTFAADYLSATPDGLITGLPADALAHLGIPDILSDCILVECKTADPRTRLDRAKPEHIFQVQAQLGLVRERTNHQPEYAVISYTDTSFWDEVKEFPVRFDPGVYLVAKTRARAIMSASSAAETRPEGIVAGGAECNYCPFASACGITRAAAVPAEAANVDHATATILARKARQAKALRAEADAAERQAKEIEQDIKEMLQRAGTRRFVGDGVAITYAAVKGRPSWDMKSLRAAAEEAGIDLSKYETTGEPTDRLSITIKDSEAAASDVAAKAA